MVLAFSLQSDVKSIGAYAGFAAIIGLALLVLLYFAQAREVRRMSDLLEQQEDRLRSLPASARQLVPRPVAAPPGRELPTPQVSQAQPAAAASTATVAVPGVRRVSVGGAAASGAGGVQALAATGALGEAGTTAVPVAGAQALTAAGAAGDAGITAAPVAAATVAGAMAAAPAAPAAVSGESSSGADAAALAPAAPEPGEDAELVKRQDEGSPGERAGSGGGGSAEPSTPNASVPLVARPAATAEPIGSAQLLDEAVAAPAGAELSFDTAETAIVEGTGGAQAAESPSAEPESAEALGSGTVAVAALEPEPAGEISAEGIAPSVFDFTAGSTIDDVDEQARRRPSDRPGGGATARPVHGCGCAAALPAAAPTGTCHAGRGGGDGGGRRSARRGGGGRRRRRRRDVASAPRAPRATS